MNTSFQKLQFTRNTGTNFQFSKESGVSVPHEIFCIKMNKMQ